MRYSEAKKFIRPLRAAGWFKWPGFHEYRKIWRVGELRYGQAITVRHLFEHREHITEILEQAEIKADREIREHLKKAGIPYE